MNQPTHACLGYSRSNPLHATGCQVGMLLGICSTGLGMNKATARAYILGHDCLQMQAPLLCLSCSEQHELCANAAVSMCCCAHNDKPEAACDSGKGLPQEWAGLYVEAMTKLDWEYCQTVCRRQSLLPLGWQRSRTVYREQEILPGRCLHATHGCQKHSPSSCRRQCMTPCMSSRGLQAHE